MREGGLYLNFGWMFLWVAEKKSLVGLEVRTTVVLYRLIDHAGRGGFLQPRGTLDQTKEGLVTKVIKRIFHCIPFRSFDDLHRYHDDKRNSGRAANSDPDRLV